jgi:hypothetical protein
MLPLCGVAARKVFVTQKARETNSWLHFTPPAATMDPNDEMSKVRYQAGILFVDRAPADSVNGRERHDKSRVLIKLERKRETERVVAPLKATENLSQFGK